MAIYVKFLVRFLSFLKWIQLQRNIPKWNEIQSIGEWQWCFSEWTFSWYFSRANFSHWTFFVNARLHWMWNIEIMQNSDNGQSHHIQEASIVTLFAMEILSSSSWSSSRSSSGSSSSSSMYSSLPPPLWSSPLICVAPLPFSIWSCETIYHCISKVIQIFMLQQIFCLHFVTLYFVSRLQSDTNLMGV